MVFEIFTLYGSWEILDSLKILIGGAPTISTIGQHHSENFIFWRFFRPPTRHKFLQLGSNKCPRHGFSPKPDPSRKMRIEIPCKETSSIPQDLPSSTRSWEKRCPKMSPKLSITRSEAPSIAKSEASRGPSIVKSEASRVPNFWGTQSWNSGFSHTHTHTHLDRYPRTLVRGEYVRGHPMS